jgi:hypothetical protein
LSLERDIVKRLGVFERKVLRRILGGIKVNENWRMRYNKEFMLLFGSLSEKVG